MSDREERINLVVRALAEWSCYHQDDRPRAAKHEWLWTVATIAVDALGD